MNTPKIAIVTDSTADIPQGMVKQLKINVVRNIIVIDGTSFEDGKDIPRRKFYEDLPNMKNLPTTATASSGVYQKLYSNLLEQGFCQIISIHASSLLSGIFNAASLAAKKFGNQVRVIDSTQASLGLGFQVISAAEAVLKGVSIDTTLDIVDSIRERTHVVAFLNTLEYVRRSGRVSWARASLGKLLDIKPFLEIRDGQVFNIGRVRTFKKGVSRLLQILLNLGPLERIAILHSNTEAVAQNFLDKLNLPDELSPLIINITTVLGTHVGPNAIGFAVVLKK